MTREEVRVAATLECLALDMADVTDAMRRADIAARNLVSVIEGAPLPRRPLLRVKGGG